MIRRSLAGLVFALVLASSSYGVLVSDFEGSLDGWYTDEWTAGTISMSSIGATSGTGSMLADAFVLIRSPELGIEPCRSKALVCDSRSASPWQAGSARRRYV